MIENRHIRVDYLLDTAMAFQDPRDLLEELVRAMSDQEFDSIYQFICRMHDIEPDEDKFNKLLENSNYDKAQQGNSCSL